MDATREHQPAEAGQADGGRMPRVRVTQLPSLAV
jgi:hypothetical protein